MGNIYKGEMQDNIGNTVYPHTESDVVFCSDGETAQAKLARYEDALGNVTGTTDSLEVSDSNILATSKAVNATVTNIYVGEDGKLHKVQGGADSVLPFSSGISLENTTCILSGGNSVNITGGKKYIAVALGRTQNDTRGASISMSAPTCEITYLTTGTGWGNYSAATGHNVIIVALLDCKSNGTVSCSYYYSGGMLVFELES